MQNQPPGPACAPHFHARSDQPGEGRASRARWCWCIYPPAAHTLRIASQGVLCQPVPPGPVSWPAAADTSQARVCLHLLTRPPAIIRCFTTWPARSPPAAVHRGPGRAIVTHLAGQLLHQAASSTRLSRARCSCFTEGGRDLHRAGPAAAATC